VEILYRFFAVFTLLKIMAVPIETKEEEPPRDPESKPHPKKSGTVKKPYPHFPSADKPDKDKQGTNSNRLNINKSSKGQYQYLDEYIWKMKVPMQLRRFFKEKVTYFNDYSSFDLSTIEYVYNSYVGFIPLLRGSKTPISKLKKVEKFRWGINCP
jgi:hypothetical protein